MLQSRHLVAQTVIGKGRQIIPSGIFLPAVIESIECLMITAKTDILGSSILILIAAAVAVLIRTLPNTSKWIVAITALRTGIWLGLLRVLDSLIGCVHLLHFLSSYRITGV